MNRPASPTALLQAPLLALLLTLFAGSSLFAQLTGNVVITFRNNSTRIVNLNSAAPGQAMRNFAQVGPGEAKSVQSAPGQNWILLLNNGKVFSEYRATAVSRQVYTINQDGGVPGAAGPSTTGPVPAPAPVPAPGVPAGSTGSKLTPQQAQQMVNYHDAKRAEVGCGKVTWSPIIAQFAQQRADTIARTKKFAHLPQGQNPYGENLAQGGGGAYTVINACEGWYAERSKMPRNARTMTVNLFNQGVGHYTQMVWKGSTQIGAGIAQYQQGGITWTVVVCCYNPPGNVIGGTIY
jgi:uncharacterized protein YkwD